MFRSIKFILILLLFTIPLCAQHNSATLSGFVYDESNGEALIGVNVYIPELAIGSATNTSGYYIIPEIPAGEHVLVCEYIGYKTRRWTLTINPDENKSIDIVLTPDILESEVIVVTADSVRTSIKLFDKPVSVLTVSPREIKVMPAVVEADLLRSLQTLPGIVSVSDFSSALYVRGGTPDQNLYLIDGSDVYNPEHAFGIFSTFNTEAIKHVEISKGGFGAQYGGRLSSVLDVTNLDGNREQFEGSASLSLLAAKTTLQMPIGDFGSVSGSLRHTYFNETIGQIQDSLPDYYFYDGNIKAFFELDKYNKLSISGFGGRDALDIAINENKHDEMHFKYSWGNTTGSLRWIHVFSPKLFSNFWITASRFSSKFDLGEIVNVVEKNGISDLTFKGNLEYAWSQHWQSKFGFEQKNIKGTLRQSFPGVLIDIEKTPQLYALYLQTNWRPNVFWDIEAGVRYNYFDSQKNFSDIEPRFSVKYRLTETINLKAAAGRFNQYLHRIPRSFIAAIWIVSDQNTNSSRADHFILGFQKEVARDYQLEVEAYYKDYKNIHSFNHNFVTQVKADHFDDSSNPVFTETQGLFNEGKGTSRGFEFLFRKESGWLIGWLAYSYAYTEYTLGNVNQGKSFSPRHDRTSTLNFVSNLDLRNGWRKLFGMPYKNDDSKWTLGLNLVYASGQPLTMPGSAYLIGSSPETPEPDAILYPSTINKYRLPAYARLDVSLTWLKQFNTWSMAPYLQIFNIGNRKNVWYVDYDFDEKIGKTDIVSMFPVVPTIGINFTF